MSILIHGILSQGGVTATLSVSPSFSSHQWDGVACNGSITVTASAGNTWTATADDTWCNITGGSGTGNGSFSISCSISSGSVRTTTVRINSDAPQRTVFVEQMATGESCA